jgi:serine protease Do
MLPFVAISRKSLLGIHRASQARFAAACAASCLAAAWFTPARAQAPPAAERDGLENLSHAFESMIEKVSPSVVKVFVSGFAAQSGLVESTSDLLSRQRSTGSGAVVAADGYIVTNAHVVVGARRVQVLVPVAESEQAERHSILKGPGKLHGAQVVGIDLETDLAVLKIAATGLRPLPFGDSEALRKGQLVFAFGSPLGLENTVTLGVVSAVARQLRTEDPMIYIQTDAPINPGNSGGPLVNASGELVGINTLILSQSGGSEGIGFAAPSNIVRVVFEQIRAQGAVQRGAIGVNAQTITPLLAAGMRLSRDWGVILGDVYPGGPADKAGLRVGDIVVSLDGKSMENGRQLDVNLYGKKIGEKVRVEVLRGGSVEAFGVEVMRQSDPAAALVGMVNPERNLVPQLGILALNLDASLQRVLPSLRRASGVVVASRAADAPFWENGVLPGDVVYAVNGVDIRQVDDLKREIAKVKPYEPVVVQIERDGKLMYLAFEME